MSKNQIFLRPFQPFDLQIVNIALWLVAAGLCLAVVYGPYSAESGGHNSTRAERAVYNSMGRTAWSVGVAYVIIACHTGHGGESNSVDSSSLLKKLRTMRL